MPAACGLASLALLAGPAASAPPKGSQLAPLASAPEKKSFYQDGHVGRLLLGGTWLFRLDPQDQGLGQGFQRHKQEAGWTRVTIPHNWNGSDVSDESQRGTVGWYRKDFIAPRGGRGKSWKFRFESVNYRATVFLNGRKLQGGEHEGAYIPWEVHASKLKRGVNRLVIRVDNRRTDTDIPPLRDQANARPGGGWWNYGGLLREVYLRKVDRVDLVHFFAKPRLPCRSCPATVELRATLRNLSSRKQKVGMRAAVGGQSARFRSVTIPRGGQRIVRGRVKIRGPRLWEPGNPELYAVRAAATINGRGVSRYKTHIGIRSIKVSRDGRMLMNGRPVNLRGASIHEDHPTMGAALTPEVRAQNVDFLKELGATITRAHYPLHPHYLEMFDRAGIVYWDQIPFYQYRAETLRLQSVRSKGLAYLTEAVNRDRNHASVAVWSIGNELPTRVSTGQARYISRAVSIIKKEDGTRLSAIDFAGYPSVPPVQEYRVLDAIGINSYFGWYPGPNGQIVDRELLGPYLDQLHAYYPREALFITEFGAEANRNGAIDEKGTFEYQRDFMQFHVSTYDSKPYVNGAVAWILRDFKVRPDWDGGNPKPAPPINHKGLVSEDGIKKPAFEETARLYRNATPLR